MTSPDYDYGITPPSRKQTALALNVEPDGVNVLANGQRAGDTDRDKVVHHLHESFATGHIDEEELSRREALVLDPKKLPTRDHLNYMIRDLPPAKPQRKYIARVSRTKACKDFVTKPSGPLLVGQLGVAGGLVTSAIIPWTLQAGTAHISALGASLGAACTVGAVMGIVLWILWMVDVWD